jgi:hypothetical protein
MRGRGLAAVPPSVPGRETYTEAVAVRLLDAPVAVILWYVNGLV